MIIRAIDPGPVRSAFVDWNGEHIIDKGMFNNSEHYPHEDYSPFFDAVYFEQIQSYGMPVGADVFSTCFWSGRLWERYIDEGFTCEFKGRKDVKLAICGSARAKDSNIIAAIVDIFDPDRKHGATGKGTKKAPGPLYGIAADVWQALALALAVLPKKEE